MSEPSAPCACPAGGDRPLGAGEIALVRSIFGDAIDYAAVRLKRRRWFPLQPVGTLMAPSGHVHFHPRSELYCDDFAQAGIGLQGLFIHEMTHVWQSQHKGRWYLPLMRHPLCRYDYSIRPGWPLHRYGIEQQAEIVRHAFLLRNGARVPGIVDAAAYALLVNFPGAR
ncbi:vgr related protein [Novosphingobium album (ex Liu et al. 2023)]|uniref:Vgr related protein n=1 Tax=Novosphingobium album (ex Liu et al. 2023) TaxID=3031130 RepID=A0ABT5WPH2_9SPHN|nr:vgr related protein [Novosphingobium album (ex Liu et al. 2023)]MDE8651930.1 vgr related protein [Novosphingobium album (ex Liu et al. 2023)]